LFSRQPENGHLGVLEGSEEFSKENQCKKKENKKKANKTERKRKNQPFEMGHHRCTETQNLVEEAGKFRREREKR